MCVCDFKVMLWNAKTAIKIKKKIERWKNNTKYTNALSLYDHIQCSQKCKIEQPYRHVHVFKLYSFIISEVSEIFTALSKGAMDSVNMSKCNYVLYINQYKISDLQLCVLSQTKKKNNLYI